MMNKAKHAILTIASALALVLPIGVIPSVHALPPGCDWSTDAGTQACMGGSSFDAGKNGHGDTYGPSGDAGFLHDVRLVLRSLGGVPDKEILDLGHLVCTNRQKGYSEDEVKHGLANAFNKSGLDSSAAPYFVIDAEMYLCPGF